MRLTWTPWLNCWPNTYETGKYGKRRNLVWLGSRRLQTLMFCKKKKLGVLLEKSLAYRDRMVRETVRCVTFVNSALSCQTLYKTYGPMRQLSKTLGGKIVDPVWDLSLYSSVLVCIYFSPYLSCGTKKKNLLNNQELLLLRSFSSFSWP